MRYKNRVLILRRAMCLFLSFFFAFLFSSCAPLSSPSKWRGWLAYWDFDAAADSFLKHAFSYEEINLFSYALNEDGTIYRHDLAENQRRLVLSKARSRRLPVFATVVNDVIVAEDNFRLKDPEIIGRILGDKRKREAHVKELATLVKEHNFTGLDIDYENLHVKDREGFTQFIEELAAALHALNKKLSVTVEPKFKEVSYQGPGAADWQKIALSADQVRIMCYSFHYVNSEPGSIVPQDWLKDIILYAQQKIPNKKIVIVLPFLGMDWVEKGEADSYTTAKILSGQKEREVVPRLDEKSFSKYYFYKDEQGRKREVWYEDAGTLKKKMDLARELGIEKFIFWRLGGEDPLIYQ